MRFLARAARLLRSGTSPASFRKRFSPARSLSSSTPSCRFGMISDLQYADIDDDKNFSGSEMRGYRGSLAVLERAAKAWQMQSHSFVLQLGDIIDGQNSGKYGQGLSKFPADGSESDVALHKVLASFSRYGWSNDKIYSAVGNHEFYCWPERSVVASKIPQIAASASTAGPSDGRLFQSFSPAPGWRIIILDAYDVSVIGRPLHDPAFKEAIGLLRSNNPNILADGSASANFLTNIFVPYNGAIGRDQMGWLKAALDKSRSDGEFVIMCSHIPILPASAIPSCLLWNFQEVLDLVREHNTSCASGPGRIVSVFSGHFHGGRTIVDSEILYVSLRSPLLSPDAFYSVRLVMRYPSVAHLTLQQVELYENRLRVLSPLSAPYICDEFVFA